MSTARTLIGTLKTQLQDIDGSGSYTFDLSLPDRIQIGRFAHPPFTPFLFLSMERATSLAENPISGDPSPFNHYWREVTLLVRGFVAGSDGEDRTLEALDLLADVYRAIEADVSLGGTTVNVSADGQAYNGDEDGVAPGYGVIDVELRFYWLSTAAQGL